MSQDLILPYIIFSKYHIIVWMCYTNIFLNQPNIGMVFWVTAHAHRLLDSIHNVGLYCLTVAYKQVLHGIREDRMLMVLSFAWTLCRMSAWACPNKPVFLSSSPQIYSLFPVETSRLNTSNHVGVGRFTCSFHSHTQDLTGFVGSHSCTSLL